MITDEQLNMMQIMASVKDMHCRLCGFKTTDKEEFRKHIIECVKKS